MSADVLNSVDPAAHQFNGSGWLLPEDVRERLLARFPPHYPDVIAHHVTFAPPSLPRPDLKSAEIVGIADDGAGVETLVVRLNGSTDRPDGSTWHVTWSLDRARGRKAVESNAVIRRRGWTPVDPPVPLPLQPW